MWLGRSALRMMVVIQPTAMKQRRDHVAGVHMLVIDDMVRKAIGKMKPGKAAGP